ncbi:hypothetical protein BDQ17DRAFT_373361 [Cyathus striatus]|nr:hypothetical protein BDQ17DRAFT_373361 [Cyathus striatus]
MKLAYVYGLLIGVKDFIYAGAWPTIKTILWNLTLLFRLTVLSKEFMFHVWNVWEDTIDENCRADKERLLTPHAHDIVLDIGAGHGHTVYYLDHDKVTKYAALESNVLMHNKIREHASKVGFNESDGSLVILPYGAENISATLSALGGAKWIQ